VERSALWSGELGSNQRLCVTKTHALSYAISGQPHAIGSTSLSRLNSDTIASAMITPTINPSRTHRLSFFRK
jgi:hypothetical protein